MDSVKKIGHKFQAYRNSPPSPAFLLKSRNSVWFTNDRDSLSKQKKRRQIFQQQEIREMYTYQQLMKMDAQDLLEVAEKLDIEVKAEDELDDVVSRILAKDKKQRREKESKLPEWARKPQVHEPEPASRPTRPTAPPEDDLTEDVQSLKRRIKNLEAALSGTSEALEDFSKAQKADDKAFEELAEKFAKFAKGTDERFEALKSKRDKKDDEEAEKNYNKFLDPNWWLTGKAKK